MDNTVTRGEIRLYLRLDYGENNIDKW
jgi:hypothetical protein